MSLDMMNLKNHMGGIIVIFTLNNNIVDRLINAYHIILNSDMSPKDASFCMGVIGEAIERINDREKEITVHYYEVNK
jgi:hypothetical protein